MDNLPVPKENIEIFSYLYVIENTLRELIIDLMEKTDGPHWYKKRLPKDVLEKFLERGKEYESKVKWTELIPHHPIYYIDFSDLKKIIESENNKEVFSRIFKGRTKKIIISTLSELEPIRNKIAHNRKATDSDVKIVKAAYVKLLKAIGEDYFNNLSERCTCKTDIFDQLAKLQKEAERSFYACINYQPLNDDLPMWKSIRDMWWFDEIYLGSKLGAIKNFFWLLEQYASLPRKRGTGHKIEVWVKSNDIKTKFKNAQDEFSLLLNKN
jgi:hypothetical protein